jgi:hypothetical protein
LEILRIERVKRRTEGKESSKEKTNLKTIYSGNRKERRKERSGVLWTIIVVVVKYCIKSWGGGILLVIIWKLKRRKW